MPVSRGKQLACLEFVIQSDMWLPYQLNEQITLNHDEESD